MDFDMREIHKKNIADTLKKQLPNGGTPEQEQIVVSWYICEVLNHFGLNRQTLTMDVVLVLAELYREYRVIE